VVGRRGGGGKKSRATWGILLFGARTRSARSGASYTCGLLNSDRSEFISRAAESLSMRVGLAVPGPGTVITSRQEEREERSGSCGERNQAS